MAYSPEQWERAKALFELGKSLQEIADALGFKDKTSISKRAKAESWVKHKNQQLKDDIKGIDQENSTLELKKAGAIEKLSKLSDFEITIIDQVIQDETGNKSLLFSTANLSLIRKNQLLTRNTKTVVDFEIVYGENGKPIKRTPVSVEVELSASDLKAIDEGMDKNAVTLELAPRHAKTEINNTNAQQNNNPPSITLTRES